MPQHQQQGDVAALHAAFDKRVVQRAQAIRGTFPARRERAHQTVHMAPYNAAAAPLPLESPNAISTWLSFGC